MSPAASRQLARRRARRSRRSPACASPPGASPDLRPAPRRSPSVRRDRVVRRAPRPRRASSCGSHRVGCVSVRDRDRGLVEREVALGEAGHRELRRRAARPRSTRSLAQVVGVEQPAQRGAQRLGVAGRRRAAPPGPARATLRVALDGRRDDRVPAAIASSSTTPNDSWPSDGAQNTVARRSRARLLVVGDRARATRRSACGARAAPRSAARRSRPTAPRRGRGRPTRRAARRAPCAARGGRGRTPRAGRSASGPPSRSARRRCRSAARCTSRRAPPRAISARRRPTTAVRIVSWRAALDRDLLQRLVRGVTVLARGVERADLRAVAAEQRALVGPGHERLVQVHDVGLEAAQRLERALATRASGPGPSARSSRCSRTDARADRHDAGLGRRAVARADDPDVDAELAQRAGEAEHLALHAAGRDSEYGEIDRRPSRRTGSLVRGRRRSRSRGQFGCIRCHCSGAMRISSSKRRASSWVIRATSSRRRPSRSHRQRRADHARSGRRRGRK